LASSCTLVISAKAMFTVPETTAIAASPAPLKGTWAVCTLAASLKSSDISW
jgi:hypothetical protein